MTQKGCTVICVKILCSDAIISWNEKTVLIGVAPLISQPSLCGKASKPDILCRLDLPLLWKLVSVLYLLWNCGYEHA